MTIRNIATFTALVCVVLFALLFLNAGLYTETYGVARDNGSAFLGRRASPMFLGLAVLLWLARTAPPSELRNAIGIGTAVLFAGIAITGVFAFFSGIASFLIVVAAAFELLIAFGFIATLKR